MSERGFSLLEVLVAFAILSIAIGVLLQIFATGLRSVSLSDEYTTAAFLAESRLAEVGVTEELEEGTEEGEIDERYRWRSEVVPYEPPEEDLDLVDDDTFIPYDVSVEVLWGEGQRVRSVKLRTLRLEQAQ